VHLNFTGKIDNLLKKGGNVPEQDPQRKKFSRLPHKKKPSLLLAYQLQEFLKYYCMIRKLKSGEYRIYSRKVDTKTNKRRNPGTFKTLEAAKKHEREIQAFKHK
jgi:hypothetical protein